MPPAEPEGSRWWIPVLVIGLILAAIALLLWLFASDILGGDDASPTPTLVVVPNVVGERVRVAEETLTGEGLTVAEERIEVPIEDPATEVPGTVVEQDRGRRAGTGVPPSHSRCSWRRTP
jgi:beta-lactam-binding protein with PASTA domain